MISHRLALALLLGTAAPPVLAAPAVPLDQRVDRVEKELRAVQRKVFPGGAGFSEPEIAPLPVQAQAGQPASAPLNDLTARVDAMEREVARLTGQLEQDEHRLTLLSEQAAKDRQEFDTRLKLVEGAGAATAAGAAPPPRASAAPTMEDELTPGAPPRPSKTNPIAKRPAPVDDTASPVPAPAAAATGDPAEDAYMAGYRLWAARKYPEAEAALKGVVARYPKHKRASYAQNLLGRAYLDDGHPATAAEAFAANYQTNPRGERAPESLYYLGQSLMQLKKPGDACRVYDELASAYGDKVAEPLKTRVATARRDAKCK